MNAHDIRQILLRDYGLRIGPHMSRYILSQLRPQRTQPLFVIGGDARTGVPVRQAIALNLTQPPTPPSGQGELFT